MRFYEEGGDRNPQTNALDNPKLEGVATPGGSPRGLPPQSGIPEIHGVAIPGKISRGSLEATRVPNEKIYDSPNMWTLFFAFGFCMSNNFCAR